MILLLPFLRRLPLGPRLWAGWLCAVGGLVLVAVAVVTGDGLLVAGILTVVAGAVLLGSTRASRLQ